MLGTTDETLREVTRESLVAAGSRLSRDHCVGRLKDGMRHLDRDGQLAALEVAGQLKETSWLELLDAAGHSGTDSLVDAATRLLGRWSSPDAADVLAGLARDLDEPKYQVRALRGLLRIVRQFDLPLERRIELTVAAARRDLASGGAAIGAGGAPTLSLASRTAYRLGLGGKRSR
ncbi:MAG: hypothetical protein R3B96_01780 [Pirellulaceae bacterium]